MSTNRGMIKWAPFSAVTPGNSMVNDVLAKKNKVEMPILSDDQINEINNKITTAFRNKDVIKVKYYKAGKFYEKQGIITEIDTNNAKIVLNNDFSVFFSQIIKIY
jgi:hypothetical protein